MTEDVTGSSPSCLRDRSLHPRPAGLCRKPEYEISLWGFSRWAERMRCIRVGVSVTPHSGRFVRSSFRMSCDTRALLRNSLASFLRTLSTHSRVTDSNVYEKKPFPFMEPSNSMLAPNIHYFHWESIFYCTFRCPSLLFCNINCNDVLLGMHENIIKGDF